MSDKTKSLSKADQLRARADDVVSITRISGPKNVSGVQAALRILADIEDGKEDLVHKPAPVRKRHVE